MQPMWIWKQTPEQREEDQKLRLWVFGCPSRDRNDHLRTILHFDGVAIDRLRSDDRLPSATLSQRWVVKCFVLACYDDRHDACV
jgi:hypothetical protein